jgi:hypothetical protein
VSETDIDKIAQDEFRAEQEVSANRHAKKSLLYGVVGLGFQVVPLLVIWTVLRALGLMPEEIFSGTEVALFLLLAVGFAFNIAAIMNGISSMRMRVRGVAAKGTWKAGTGVVCGLVSVVIVCCAGMGFAANIKPMAYRIVCGENLKGLGNAMAVYAGENDHKYPPTERWCDLLSAGEYASERQFICRRAGAGRCNFAMNPDAEPNSLPDVVLLFETKAGWNQFGGPEILTTENHRGEGCTVAFVDARVKFVRTSKLGTLKWK